MKGRPLAGNQQGGPDARDVTITTLSITRDGQLAFDDVLIGTLPPRLASRIEVAESGCWLWAGRLDCQGYGRLGDVGAHVLVWRALHGPVPPGLELDHLCRVHACVNAAAHLEPVTHRVNCLRGVSFSAVNFRKTHCGTCGREYDSLNTYVSPDGRRDCRACIRRRVREYQGRQRELAEQDKQREELVRAA